MLSSVQGFLSERFEYAYRTGGDEFGLLLTQEDEAFDGNAFEADIKHFVSRETGLDVEISGGGVKHPGGDFGLDPGMDEMVISTAQQLLIRAKHLGRNRIVWLPHDPTESVDLMALTVSFYKELARVNASLARQMEMESRIDFLTGLYNRRGFEDFFEKVAQASRRRGTPVALLYMDSDSLKKINDAQGHDAGDRFIRDIARILKEVVRSSDFISRWGADEFAVVLEQTSQQNTLALAERIRAAMAERTEGTVSIGVYCGVPEDTEAAVGKADDALYRAKKKGKNRVELAG